MIVHFWSGATLAFLMPFVALSENFLVGLAFIGMVAWELIEYFFDIHEVVENRMLDVVYGLAGIWVVRTFITPLIGTYDGTALVVAIVILVTLGVMGWRAFQKRSADTGVEMVAEVVDTLEPLE